MSKSGFLTRPKLYERFPKADFFVFNVFLYVYYKADVTDRELNELKIATGAEQWWVGTHVDPTYECCDLGGTVRLVVTLTRPVNLKLTKRGQLAER